MRTPQWNQIATSSYSAYRPAMGVPVRTSIGFPKWWSDPVEFAQILRPLGIFGNQSKFPTALAEEEAYHDRLWSLQGMVEEALSELTDKYPGETLVMLCYENVVKPGEYCHRTWLSRWLSNEYGITTNELSVVRGVIKAVLTTTQALDHNHPDQKTRALTRPPNGVQTQGHLGF